MTEPRKPDSLPRRGVTVFEGNRALLTAFRRGERNALETVYRATVDDVLTVLRLDFRIRSADEQMELAQEIFVKAFSESGRQGYDGLRPYRPYLKRIAKNHMVDRLRKSGREAPLEEAHDVPEEAPEPEEDLDQKRLREATRAFLARQDDELRRFVELRFEKELSQRDVLAEMRVTRRRVRTLEKRALDGLRAHLESLGLR